MKKGRQDRIAETLTFSYDAKKVWFLYKGSLSLIEKKFSYNSLEAIC